MTLDERKEIIQPILLDGEEVVWLGYDSVRSKVEWLSLAIPVAIVFVLTFKPFFKSINESYFGILLYALFLAFIVALVIGYRYLKAKRFLATSYVLTNYRVLSYFKFRKKEELKEIDFEDVFNIKNPSTNEVLTFETEYGTEIEFYGISEASNVYELGVKQLMESTKYNTFNNRLKGIAEKYTWEYLEYNLDNNRIYMKGAVDEMVLNLNIKGFFPKNIFELQVTCPNTENNAFKIASETGLKKLHKRIGAQDLELGDQKADEQYIFQSNDANFLNLILDEQSLWLLKALDPLVGEISFGNLNLKRASKVYKKKTKLDDSILDAHLLGENITPVTQVKDIDASRESMLTLKMHLRHIQNYDFLALTIERLCDLSRRLAKAIQTYDKALKNRN